VLFDSCECSVWIVLGRIFCAIFVFCLIAVSTVNFATQTYLNYSAGCWLMCAHRNCSNTVTLRTSPNTFVVSFFTFMWPCIVTNFFIIKPTRCTNFTNLFWHETLHVSHSSSVHHQESCSKCVYKPVWYIPLLSLQWLNSWWWTDELSETCRISCQNKFVKLLHLVGFIIKKFLFFALVRLSSYVTLLSAWTFRLIWFTNFISSTWNFYLWGTRFRSYKENRLCWIRLNNFAI
jgi:hypothetical protein